MLRPMQDGSRFRVVTFISVVVGGGGDVWALALRQGESYLKWIRSDERLMLETWAFGSLYRGQITVSYQLCR